MNEETKIEKVDLINSNLPDFMIEQYDALFDMLNNEQYYGVLYQSKDFLELFIKLPVIVLTARLVEFFNQCEDLSVLTNDELDNAKSILENKILGKAMSLGDWEELSKDKFLKLKESVIFNTDSKELYINLFEQLEHIKNAQKKFKVGDYNSITQWRNAKLGHGATATNIKYIKNDAKDMVEAINSFLKEASYNKENYVYYRGVVFGHSNPAVIENDQEPFLKEKQECSFIIRGYSRDISYSPYIFFVDHNILMFEGYDANKGAAAVLDYNRGELYIEDRLFCILKNLCKKLKIDERKDNGVEDDIITLECDNQLREAAQGQYTRIKRNTVFSKAIMNSFEMGKRVVWLQAYRGMGKSVFASEIEKNKSMFNSVLHENVFPFVYYVNSYYNYTTDAFVNQFTRFAYELAPTQKDSREYSIALANFIEKYTGNYENKERGKAFLSYLDEVKKCKLGDAKILMVFDGLDEIPAKDNNNAIDISMFLNTDKLPDYLYVILLSRTTEELDTKYIFNNSVEKLKSSHNDDYFHILKITSDNDEYRNLIDTYTENWIKKDFNYERLNAKEKRSIDSEIKLVKPLIVQKADYRFIYVVALLKCFSDENQKIECKNCANLLKEYNNVLEKFCGFGEKELNQDNVTGNEIFLKQYFENLSFCGEKYRSYAKRLLIVLSLVGEKITVQELSFLLEDTSKVSFKLAALIYDLSPFIYFDYLNGEGLVGLSNIAWRNSILSLDRSTTLEIKARLEYRAVKTVDTVAEHMRVNDSVFRVAENDSTIHILNLANLKPIKRGLCNRFTLLLVQSFYPFDKNQDITNCLKIRDFCNNFSVDYSEKTSYYRILKVLYNFKDFPQTIRTVEEFEKHYIYSQGICENGNTDALNLLLKTENPSTLYHLAVREYLQERYKNAIELLDKSIVKVDERKHNLYTDYVYGHEQIRSASEVSGELIAQIYELYSACYSNLNNYEKFIEYTEKEIDFLTSQKDLKKKVIACMQSENGGENVITKTTEHEQDSILEVINIDKLGLLECIINIIDLKYRLHFLKWKENMLNLSDELISIEDLSNELQSAYVDSEANVRYFRATTQLLCLAILICGELDNQEGLSKYIDLAENSLSGYYSSIFKETDQEIIDIELENFTSITDILRPVLCNFYYDRGNYLKCISNGFEFACNKSFDFNKNQPLDCLISMMVSYVIIGENIKFACLDGEARTVLDLIDLVSKFELSTLVGEFEKQEIEFFSVLKDYFLLFSKNGLLNDNVGLLIRKIDIYKNRFGRLYELSLIKIRCLCYLIGWNFSIRQIRLEDDYFLLLVNQLETVLSEIQYSLKTPEDVLSVATALKLYEKYTCSRVKKVKVWVNNIILLEKISKHSNVSLTDILNELDDKIEVLGKCGNNNLNDMLFKRVIR